MATLAVVPASGSVVSVQSAVRVTVSGADVNDTTTYDTTKYPTETPFVYYFRLAQAGQDNLESHRFSVSADGDAWWDNVILPAAGTWTLSLRDASDDSEVVSTSVVVS